MSHIFHDRIDAGQSLATALLSYASDANVMVLALPRGGVPVGFEVAQALGVPLDVLLVRKLGVPWQPELAMGAIAIGGVRVFNEDIVSQLSIDEGQIQTVIDREQAVLDQRNQRYRAGRSAPDVKNKTVILVDDGVATGATTRVAINALRQLGAETIVLAVPVGPQDTMAQLSTLVDDVVCLEMPEPFWAIGYWYDNFDQTSDDQVMDCLTRAKKS